MAIEFPVPVAPPHPLGLKGNAHDPRNFGYRALAVPPPERPEKYWGDPWRSRVVFDQGETSRCTTESAVGLLYTSPFFTETKVERQGYDNASQRQELYEESKRYDPWPGEDYDGSSTDAPFRVLRNRGVISAWRWLFGEDEVREWVIKHGPVGVGTIWMMNMFEPGRHGWLDIGGAPAGGHAYRIVQYSEKRDAYRIVNSWGRAWGQQGRAWLHATDLDTLLDQGGEAVTI